MKHMVMMALLGVSVVVTASDQQNKVRTLLMQNFVATELDWRNQNIGNVDFEGLGAVAPHVKKLDLSDNSFTGDFPLIACLRAFPNVETLTLNNNTRITGFAIDKDYKNTTLKVLNVENSGCQTVPVNFFYKNFELETLDLSNSKQLNYPGCAVLDLRTSGKILQVYLRNVVAEEKQLQLIKAGGSIETNVAFGIRAASAVGIGIVGGLLLVPCTIFTPNYCLRYPVPVPYEGSDQLSGWHRANHGINVTVVAALSYKLGFDYLGGAIVRRCLPNGGKVTAVKYITNSSDETV